VSIGGAQGEQTLLRTMSGEDGGFRFVGLEAGKYWLRAEAKGFARQAFEEHEGFFTGIVTGGTVDSEHLMFALRPDAAIVGAILDEANEPVRDAQVMLFRRQMQDGREMTSPNANAAVNDEGHYRFDHLPAGTYFVAVRATPWYAQNGQIVREGVVKSVDGRASDVVTESAAGVELGEPAEETEPDRALDVAYPVTYYPGATEESGATPLILQAGERVTADVRLSPVPALHVRVHKPPVDPNEPVGANVMQRIFDGPEQPVQGQSMQSEKGEFELSGFAPGDYEVKVQSYGKMQQSWSQHVALRSDTEVSMERGTAFANVKGVVKIEGDANADKRGFVQLSNRATDEKFGAQISEKGEFEFSATPVGPGTYAVEAGTSRRARLGSVTATGAKVAGLNVEIGDAGTVQLTLNLWRGLGEVNGTVLRDGKPVPGAMVVLVPHDPQNNVPLVRRDQSDLDGTFTLAAVLPGKYTVVAIHDGWEMDWMNPQVLDGFLKNGETVEVVADRKYDVKVGVQ